MGGLHTPQATSHRRGQLGKIDAPLNKMLESVEWGEYRLGDLFEIRPTKAYKYTNRDLFSFSGDTPVVTNTSFNNGISGTVGLDPTEEGGIITYSDTTTSDAIFYQPYPFVGYSHIQGLYPKNREWSKNALLYVVVSFRKSSNGLFDYGNKFNRAIASDMSIALPTRESEIDFEFMERFIALLNAQRLALLNAYLSVTGLKDYTLTPEEEQAVKDLEEGNVEWGMYRLGDLFGEATRGKRLKSEDRISGNLPFVTAGEADMGVSAFIGNDVEVFQPNTITIDMFGSAKYRNYAYGADDHVAVVHTQNLPKHAVCFITSAIHKVANAGDFHYGRNFYAKDAAPLIVSLFECQGCPDYGRMETLISAIEKLVIKDVVLYADREIEATKQVVDKTSKNKPI